MRIFAGKAKFTGCSKKNDSFFGVRRRKMRWTRYCFLSSNNFSALFQMLAAPAYADAERPIEISKWDLHQDASYSAESACRAASRASRDAQPVPAYQRSSLYNDLLFLKKIILAASIASSKPRLPPTTCSVRACAMYRLPHSPASQ